MHLKNAKRWQSFCYKRKVLRHSLSNTEWIVSNISNNVPLLLTTSVYSIVRLALAIYHVHYSDNDYRRRRRENLPEQMFERACRKEVVVSMAISMGVFI